MTAYVSLLRGINAGGQKKIKMEELKGLYLSLDFSKIQTYIQSVNVVFESPDTNSSELKDFIEKAIRQTFGFSTEVLLRSKTEFEGLIEGNPFLPGKKEDAAKLHVTFLSDFPEERYVIKLDIMEVGLD